jgi:hypothetical protein
MNKRFFLIFIVLILLSSTVFATSAPLQNQRATVLNLVAGFIKSTQELIYTQNRFKKPIQIEEPVPLISAFDAIHQYQRQARIIERSV